MCISVESEHLEQTFKEIHCSFDRKFSLPFAFKSVANEGYHSFQSLNSSDRKKASGGLLAFANPSCDSRFI